MIDPQAGDLDLREFINQTPKRKQMSINILKYMKNIFLLNSHLKIETSANPTAGKLFNNEYQEFVEKAEECVKKSVDDRFAQSDDFTIKFSEYDTVHEKILNNLKERPEETLNDKVVGFRNWLVGAWDDLQMEKRNN